MRMGYLLKDRVLSALLITNSVLVTAIFAYLLLSILPAWHTEEQSYIDLNRQKSKLHQLQSRTQRESFITANRDNYLAIYKKRENGYSLNDFSRYLNDQASHFGITIANESYRSNKENHDLIKVEAIGSYNGLKNLINSIYNGGTLASIDSFTIKRQLDGRVLINMSLRLIPASAAND